MKVRRPARALLAAVLVAGGLVAAAVVAPSPASAETNTATVPYRCESQFFNVAYDELVDVSVTITTPDTVTSGDPIPVTYTLVSPPTGPPIPFGAVVAHASPTVTAQLATGGPVVTASGVGPDSAPTSMAPGAAYPVAGAVSMTIPGSTFVTGNLVRIRPGALMIEIVSGDDGIGGGIVTCAPEPSPAPYVTSVFVEATTVPTADQCTADVGAVNTGSCFTTQQLNATILSGSLRQDVTATGANPDAVTVNLGSVTSSTTGSTLPGTLNQVRVTDNRGGVLQWSLTATMDDFVAGSKTIAADRLSITPSCTAASAGSAAGALAGAAAQDFGSAVNLCTGPSAADVGTGSTGGEWTVNGPLSLDVPPFQAAGAYVAVMTVNLA